MKKNIFTTHRVARFRHFARKGYAAFRSLHCEVTIGHVSARITNLELLKAGKAALFAAIMATTVGTSTAYADDREDANQQFSVQEVLVVANKAELQSEAYRIVSIISQQEIENLPVSTLADILQYLPGIDTRRRGAPGAQADLTMRAGTFEQVLIMLNGVPINDVHTGHYSLNIPITDLLIERIEVLQGTNATMLGTNAFAGAINIVTQQAGNDRMLLRIKSGMNGLVNPAFAGSWTRNDASFNVGAEYLSTQGYYAPNPSTKEEEAIRNSDAKQANIFFQARYKGTDLQCGLQYKDAGAGLFYGGSTDQFDATRTAFASLRHSAHWGPWSLDAQASYRANYDRYEWHRTQRLYGNFHFSQNTAAAVKLHYASIIGTTTAGLEIRNENIHSTNLGDTIHPDGQVPNVDGFDLKDLQLLNLVKGKNRFNIAYFAEQTFNYHSLNASIGVCGNWNSMFGHGVTGSANIGYEYLPHSSVYLNAQRALRLPTFTDLYYNAGNQLGSTDLKPEEAWTFALGTAFEHTFGSPADDLRHQLNITTDAYYRLGTNIIDWVYTPSDAVRPYHAKNEQTVNGAGIEFTAIYKPLSSPHNTFAQWLRLVKLNYAYTWLDLDLHEAQSRYLDYLSHKLVFTLEHGIWVSDQTSTKGLIAASWNIRWQKREGDYTSAEGIVTSYAPVLLVDGSIFWQNDKVKVTAECTNITNRHYYDYGALLMPGVMADLAVQVRLP